MLFHGPELRRMARVIGALLVMSAGLVLMFQAYLAEILPPADGFIETRATVIEKERRGTFREPAFELTLEYTIADQNLMVSSRRVDFDTYNALLEGDTVTIHYNLDDYFEWRIILRSDRLSDYGLGLLMVVFGLFSLFFPLIVSWASRESDFEYTDDLTTNPPGAMTYRYDDNSTITQR